MNAIKQATRSKIWRFLTWVSVLLQQRCAHNTQDEGRCLDRPPASVLRCKEQSRWQENEGCFAGRERPSFVLRRTSEFSRHTQLISHGGSKRRRCHPWSRRPCGLHSFPGCLLINSWIHGESLKNQQGPWKGTRFPSIFNSNHSHNKVFSLPILLFFTYELIKKHSHECCN